MTGAVLHVDTGRSWRGGQQQVFLLHRELCREHGVDSRLLAREGGELVLRCRREKLPVEVLPGGSPLNPVVLRRLFRAARGVRLVHAHDSHAASLCALLRRARRDLRFVCHRRVSYPLGGNLFSRWKYRAVDAWIAVAGEVAESLSSLGVGLEQVAVVHSALDLDTFRAHAGHCDVEDLCRELGLPPELKLVGLCGAFSPQKGHRVLVEAARLLNREDVGYVLAGEGELRREVEATVAAAELRGPVCFAGFRRDVACLTRMFTVAVVPSIDGEGSSAAIKEPMALGVPVIVSDLAANREVIGSGGEVVPRGDAAALARVLGELLDDPERCRQLGARGRLEAERFAPAAMVAGVLAVYREVAP